MSLLTYLSKRVAKVLCFLINTSIFSIIFPKNHKSPDLQPNNFTSNEYELNIISSLKVFPPQIG